MTRRKPRHIILSLLMIAAAAAELALMFYVAFSNR